MSTDFDVLDTDANAPVTLVSGLTVQVVPLKTRQFFRLLKIVTHGAGGALGSLSIDPNEGAEEFLTKLVALVVLALPDAEDESIEFIQSMVEPVGLIKRMRITKQDKEINEALWAGVHEQLYNPELEDLITLIETVIKREAEDIQALGKRLMGMFKIAQKTGQIPATEVESDDTNQTASPNSPVETFSEASPVLVTS